jgi:hypothetical protein
VDIINPLLPYCQHIFANYAAGAILVVVHARLSYYIPEGYKYILKFNKIDPQIIIAIIPASDRAITRSGPLSNSASAYALDP